MKCLGRFRVRISPRSDFAGTSEKADHPLPLFCGKGRCLIAQINLAQIRFGFGRQLQRLCQRGGG